MRAEFSLMPTRTIARAVELAVLGERLGYSRCWVYDEGLAARDVYVTLSAVALATSKLTVGPGITNPYTRHPGVTAEAIAALDEVSQGRAFLGIGAGGDLTLGPLAIAQQRPLTAVRETVEACRRLFDGDVVSLDGRHVRLRGASLLSTRPGVEIWLAGRGPRMLDLGAAACDGVMLDFMYRPRLGEVVDRIRRAAATAGKDVGIAYSTMLVTDDASLACAKANMTYRLVNSPEEVRAALGMPSRAVAEVREALSHGAQAAAECLRDEWVLPFVISGTVAECAERLHALAVRLGLSAFVVPLLDDEAAEESLRVAARIVGLES